jgi:hypothetical protein
MRRLTSIVVLIFLVNQVRADLTSTSSLGIRSSGLNLDGTGVLIGQVEGGRPGDPDKDLSDYFHEQTNPTQVYAGTSVDSANSVWVQGRTVDMRQRLLA